jgi:hypothetical protein
MTSRRQWVGFRFVVSKSGGKPEKKPSVADHPNKFASIADPTTWRDFSTAVNALDRHKVHAVAYAIRPEDRIVFIDLDGPRWAQDGNVTPEAMALLSDLGGYAELSVSGNGIHILMKGDGPAKGVNNGRGVEVYGQNRFVICTGRHIPGTPRSLVENRNAVDSLILREFSNREPSLPVWGGSSGLPQSPLSPLSHLSPLSPLSLSEEQTKIIRQTLPREEGTRNRAVLNLARVVRFNLGMKLEVDFARIKAIVRWWHNEAIESITTKEFEVTWRDFVYAFGKAKMRFGKSVLLETVLEKAKDEPHPLERHYSTPNIKRTVSICYHLARSTETGVFFLSGRILAGLLNSCRTDELTKEITHDDARRTLVMLAAEGILRVEAPGNSRAAGRYEWLGSEPPELNGDGMNAAPSMHAEAK